MSDRSALAERQETRAERKETRDEELETDVTEALTPALSQGKREKTEQEVAEVAEEREQKETEGTKGDEQTHQVEVHEPEPLTPALSQGEREHSYIARLAERIRQSEALPAGLRARLAELVSASDSDAADAAIRAVEASLPGALVIGPSQIARPAHPAGDVFFHGDAEAVSEDAAEALARGQLARSGMLRGQRARVAE
jgi:hypothetical protein